MWAEINTWIGPKIEPEMKPWFWIGIADAICTRETNRPKQLYPFVFFSQDFLCFV